MSDWGAVLDVAIGLSFLYLMTSLFVTVVQESLAILLQLRGRMLFEAIENLVLDESLRRHPDYRDLVVDIYRHPLMQGLYRSKPSPERASAREFVRAQSLPSYIPSHVFAIALFDVLRGKNATESAGLNQVFASAKESIDKMPPSRLKAALSLFVSDFDSFRMTVDMRGRTISERVERWFDDAMARVSGWYTRQARRMSLAIGFSVAVLLNANTFSIAGRLWYENTLRVQVTATASALYKEQATGVDRGEGHERDSIAARWENQMKRLEESSLPFGWPYDIRSNLPRTVTDWLTLIFGWIVTAIGTSIGASLWFDALGRVVQIRGSGPRIGSSSPRSSRLRPALLEAGPISAAVARSSGVGRDDSEAEPWEPSERSGDR